MKKGFTIFLLLCICLIVGGICKCTRFWYRLPSYAGFSGTLSYPYNGTCETLKSFCNTSAFPPENHALKSARIVASPDEDGIFTGIEYEYTPIPTSACSMEQTSNLISVDDPEALSEFQILPLKNKIITQIQILATENNMLYLSYRYADCKTKSPKWYQSEEYIFQNDDLENLVGCSLKCPRNAVITALGFHVKSIASDTYTFAVRYQCSAFNTL